VVVAKKIRIVSKMNMKLRKYIAERGWALVSLFLPFAIVGVGRRMGV